MFSTGNKEGEGYFPKVKKQILSEILDMIADETDLSFEQVGGVVTRWTKYFNFWFDRKCLACGSILDEDSIGVNLSQKCLSLKLSTKFFR